MAQPLMPEPSSKRYHNQKYFLSDSGREMLMRYYDGKHETTQMLVKCLGVPRHIIYRWALKLGLKQRGTRTWTEREIHYLESNIHQLSMEQLMKHLKRTECSIVRKAYELGLSKSHEGYTLSALVAAFGVHHKTIERWVAKGWLRGKRRQTRRTHLPDIWYFSDANVRDFVKRHPEEVNPTKADWLWLVDVLCGIGEIGRESER